MEEAPYKFKPWPAWRYDPATGQGKVFDSEAEVPAGWSETNPRPDPHAEPAPPPPPPAAAKAPAAPPPPPTPPAPPATAPSDGAEVDAAGVAFDPARHAATKTKTKAGLWRMKVGVSRPDNEGAAKPPAPPAPPAQNL